MAAVEELITEHIDIWTAAVKRKSGVGRGGGKKIQLYGVKKLRELIFDLAVRGLLVPQDASDEPASVLLERIAAEKAELVKAKRIKKQKALPARKGNDSPHDLPLGWEWCQFGDVLFNRDAERIPLSVDTRKSRSGPYDYYGASGVIDSIDDFLFDKPLLLIGEDGANLINRSTPIAFIAHGKYWVNNHAHVLDGLSFGLLEYACLHINAISLEAYITGTAQPKMNQAKMNSILLAIPPEVEQHRIVAKVDELMALCDQLEQRGEASITAHQTLVQTLLDALTQSASTPATTEQNPGSQHPAPTAFEQAWHRIAEHFDTLFTTEHSIDLLKQSILQLAVMGKLVPQDPSDEPASELLKRIAAEKAELVKAKKIKKQKVLPEIGEEEKPFGLPVGWLFVRFGEIANSRLGKMLDKAKNKGEELPYLRNTNLQWHRFDLDDVKLMRIGEEEKEELLLRNGDLMICEGGEPGRCAIWRNQVSEMYFQKALHRARPYSNILSEYLQICLAIDASSGALKKYFTGATIQHFVGAKLNRYVIPLPVVAEQHRIVTKVDELMALCDQLKTRIKDSQTTQLQLADAVTEQAIS